MSGCCCGPYGQDEGLPRVLRAGPAGPPWLCAWAGGVFSSAPQLQPGPGVTRSPNEFRYSKEMEIPCPLSARYESERQYISPTLPARGAAGAPVCAGGAGEGCRGAGEGCRGAGEGCQGAAMLAGCRRALQVTLQGLFFCRSCD